MTGSNFDYIPEKGRTLTTALKFKAFFASPIFGIGILFAITSLIILPILIYNSNFNSLRLRSDFPTVQGTIDDLYIQRQNSGRGYNSDVLGIFYFSYVHVNGKLYHNISYIRKQHIDLVNMTYDLESSNKCTVRFSPTNPELACIVGMSSSSVPMLAYIVTLPFLIIGLALAFKGLKKGFRNMDLLKYGVLGFGTFLRKENTKIVLMNKPVYKVFFNLKDKNGKDFEVSSLTSKPQNLEDETEEKLVYNTLNPRDAILVDSLPKIVKKYFSAS